MLNNQCVNDSNLTQRRYFRRLSHNMQITFFRSLHSPADTFACTIDLHCVSRVKVSNKMEAAHYSQRLIFTLRKKMKKPSFKPRFKRVTSTCTKEYGEYCIN